MVKKQFRTKIKRSIAKVVIPKADARGFYPLPFLLVRPANETPNERLLKERSLGLIVFLVTSQQNKPLSFGDTRIID